MNSLPNIALSIARDEALVEESYKRVKAELEALEPEALPLVNLDVQVAVSTILGALPRPLVSKSIAAHCRAPPLGEADCDTNNPPGRGSGRERSAECLVTNLHCSFAETDREARPQRNTTNVDDDFVGGLGSCSARWCCRPFALRLCWLVARGHPGRYSAALVLHWAPRLNAWCR